MNQVQQLVVNFLMARVQDGKQAETQALIEESFRRRESGTFAAGYLEELTPQVLALLKPERVNEVKTIISQFAPGFISKS